MSRVLTCTSFDTSTATCTAQAWVEQPFPSLTVAQAMQLSSAIAVVFVAAWCWKKIGQHTEK